MKRVAIRHEGGVAGPFGREAGDAMARWREAELMRDRALLRDDAGFTSLLFEGLAHLALIRTLEGRQN